MAKKKKKKKGEKKQKKKRDITKVEERIKQALSLKPPEKNPYKVENERKIERFFRFGRPRVVRADLTIRQKLRRKKRKNVKF